jgi:hypothetical protein
MEFTKKITEAKSVASVIAEARNKNLPFNVEILKN